MNIHRTQLSTIFFLLFFCCKTAWSTDYVSVATGTWTVAATWDQGVGFPVAGDNVTIAATHTVTINTAAACNNLTINGSGRLSQNRALTCNGNLTINASGRLQQANTITIRGDFTNNGVLAGTGLINFNTNPKTISGSGTWVTTNNWSFNTTTSIAVGTTITKSGNFIVNGATVTNNGSVNTTSGSVQFSGGGVWVNAASSSLTVRTAVSGSGTLTATANPNSVIFAGAGSYTIYPLTVTATFHNITVQSGLSGGTTKTLSKDLTVNGNFTLGNASASSVTTLNVNGKNLTIKGNLVTAGTTPRINNATATTTFDGSTSQTISGTIALFTCTNLTINNAAGVTTSRPMTINGTVTVSSGTFATGANAITLTSVAGVTARIGNSTGGSITGTNWIIQRYIAAGDSGWQDITSPIAAANISIWDDSLFMSIDNSCPDGMSAGQPSVYYWNSVIQDWVAVASCTESLTPTKGFELWLSTTFSTFIAKQIRTVGTPNFGTMAATVASGLDNYSLIGNPYASGMNWSLIADGGDAPNLYDYYEIYDEVNHNYATWDGSSDVGTGKLAGTGGVIPAYQGFWVSCDGGGAATLTFRESQKSATNIELVKVISPVETNILRMKIHSDKMPNAHESIIRFTENATENRDQNGDILFRKSREQASPSITPVSADNHKLSISTFPGNKQTLDIPVIATVGVPGDYIIDFKNASLIFAYGCMVLEDVSTGNTFPLKGDYVYKFTSHSEADSERKFILHCKKSSSDCYVIQNSSLDVNVSASNNGITASFYFENTTKTNISVCNILGQEVMSTIVSVSQDDITLPLPKTNSVYFIKITTKEGAVIKKIIY